MAFAGRYKETTMNIALFGASGTIGRRILNEALRRGHTVTAIVRDPTRINEQPSGMRSLAGNILDPQSVAATVAGHDSVLSAFGPSGEAPMTVVDAARSLIAGLKTAGVKRLVVVGGAGSLEVAPGVHLVDTPEFPVAWKWAALAHRDALNAFRAEGGDIDWTYVSPAALMAPGERTGKFRLGGDQLLTDAEGQSRISAEDYAIAFLDEVEHPRHVRERFTVAY
jgi:hypothetical protein